MTEVDVFGKGADYTEPALDAKHDAGEFLEAAARAAAVLLARLPCDAALPWLLRDRGFPEPLPKRPEPPRPLLPHPCPGPTPACSSRALRDALAVLGNEPSEFRAALRAARSARDPGMAELSSLSYGGASR